MHVALVLPGLHSPDLATLPAGAHMPLASHSGVDDEITGLAAILGSHGWHTALVHIDDGEFGVAAMHPVAGVRGLCDAVFGLMADPVAHGALSNAGIDAESLFLLDSDSIGDVVAAAHTRELHVAIGEDAVDHLQSLWQSPPPPAGLRSALRAIEKSIARPSLEADATPGSGTSISAELWG